MSRRRRVDPAAFALDLVSEEERATAERLERDDPLFRADVERLRSTTDALSALELQNWRPEAPPALDTDRALTLRPPATRHRRSWWLQRVLGGGAVAVAAAAFVIFVAPGREASQQLELQGLAGVPGSATLTISGNEAELTGSGMPPSGDDDFYEAWLADDSGRMMSMGTFRVGRDGAVDVHMPVGVDVSRYRFVDVSLEPDDGNPAHSRKSVMRARI